jgi:hypothetical protein
VTSNFCGSTVQEALAEALLPRGIGLLWVNTRGHDGVFFASQGGRRRRFGSAYELVDDCRHDVQGWVDYLVGRGCRRIGLCGHSLGAIKAIYSQAHAPHPAVQAVIAVSPARLSYAAFQNGPQSSLFFAAVSAAKEHVAAGRPDVLIEVQFPFPMLITAAGYLDKYGPAERYNILRFASRVACPCLFAFGERELSEGGIAFAGLPDALRALPPTGQRFDFLTIPNADHVYTGTASELATAVAQWIGHADAVVGQSQVD